MINYMFICILIKFYLIEGAGAVRRAPFSSHSMPPAAGRARSRPPSGGPRRPCSNEFQPRPEWVSTAARMVFNRDWYRLRLLSAAPA